MGSNDDAVRELLDDACDDINSMLAELEERAIAQNAGREVSVTLASRNDESGEPYAVTVMRLMKFSGRWRLMVGDGDFGDESGWSWKPISEASMENRILAAEEVPQFIMEMLRSRESQAARARAAADSMEKAMRAFDALI